MKPRTVSRVKITDSGRPVVLCEVTVLVSDCEISTILLTVRYPLILLRVRTMDLVLRMDNSWLFRDLSLPSWVLKIWTRLPDSGYHSNPKIRSNPTNSLFLRWLYGDHVTSSLMLFFNIPQKNPVFLFFIFSCVLRIEENRRFDWEWLGVFTKVSTVFPSDVVNTGYNTISSWDGTLRVV